MKLDSPEVGEEIRNRNVIILHYPRFFQIDQQFEVGMTQSTAFSRRVLCGASRILTVVATLLATMAGAEDLLPMPEPTMLTTTTPTAKIPTTPGLDRITPHGIQIPTVSARGSLAGKGWSKSSYCDITFDDSNALLFQPENARNQFANDPWREACGSLFTEIVSTKYQHLHLDYVAIDIGPCLDNTSEFSGMFARLVGDECHDFDPLTEPRSSPFAHTADEVVRLKMYDIEGYQPFRLDRIRVKTRALRLCAQPFGVSPEQWEAGGPLPGGLADATCWVLIPGYYDLSGHTDQLGTVTITGVEPGKPFIFDDIRITIY